jgi:CyaY protein
MDETAYQHLADKAFHRIEDAFKDVEAEDVDCEHAGDVLTLTFKDGKRCVVNTQRPTRQMWVAANARAWHFSYDEPRGQWLDDKGHEVELFDQLRRIVKEGAGIEVSFG